MAQICEGMDNFCIWIERLLRRVDRSDTPRLPYVGPAGGRFLNPPRPHVEITYLHTGGLESFRVGDRTQPFPEGTVSVHGVHFGNSSEDPPDGMGSWCLFMDVSGEKEFDALHEAPMVSMVPVADGPALEAAFRELQARCAALFPERPDYLGDIPSYRPPEARSSSTASTYLVKSALLGLLATVLREGERHLGTRHALSPPVQRAVDFLNLHYADSDVRLEDAARAAGLSVDHFGRVFRRRTGVPPMRYLRMIRVERSMFLLRHTELLVEEVAREVGFTDAFHFSRVFRRHAGTSPVAFRAEARSGPSD